MAVSRHQRDGFTLLEILAVVSIFALLAGIALPNFSAVQMRGLRSQADEIVALLELARQRAIVTGVPHRLLIDLDTGTYAIEWRPNGDPAEAEDDAEPANAVTVGGLPVAPDAPLELAAPDDLRAPREDDLQYVPAPGTAGRLVHVRDSIFFAGVETTGGWVDNGETFVAFQRDGSADPTTIVLEHESGHAAYLEVLPLAERIRVDYETL
jgi:prepilin-type N-terminal cleavage/methylation domain-containing protein